jgi:hypothetical protein
MLHWLAAWPLLAPYGTMIMAMASSANDGSTRVPFSAEQSRVIRQMIVTPGVLVRCPRCDALLHGTVTANPRSRSWRLDCDCCGRSFELAVFAGPPLARSPAVLGPDLAHSLRDVVKETVNPPGGRPLCAEARLALQAAQFGE